MGASQGYAIVEFTLPSAAARGKAAVDKIENDMRPDSKKARVGTHCPTLDSGRPVWVPLTLPP